MISIMIKIPGVKELVERMRHCWIRPDWCQIFSDTFSWIHFLKFLADLRHMNLHELDGIKTKKLQSQEESHAGKTSYLPPTYIASTSLKKPTGADDGVHSPISLQHVWVLQWVPGVSFSLVLLIFCYSQTQTLVSICFADCFHNLWLK